MKKILLTFILITGCVMMTPAQTFEEVEGAFTTFADDLSAALPFASTLGLNWSDSYIGQFPHLGVGMSVGAVGLPAEAFGAVLGAMTGGAADADLLSFLPAELQPYLDQFGMPFPSAVAEARIGGFALPFDIGLKVGLIPDQVDLGSVLPAGLAIDYLVYGADVRFKLIEEKGLIPELSVGGGYNYLSGGVAFQTQDPISIGGFEVPDPANPTETLYYDINLSAPELRFNWETSVFDVKAQISKKILFITPYLGIGATFGTSRVNGGAFTTVSTTPALTEQEWEDLAAALATLGEEVPQLTPEGFLISSEAANGFATRAFGGLSLNLLFLKLDVSGFYEIVSQSLGASVGLRLQF